MIRTHEAATLLLLCVAFVGGCATGEGDSITLQLNLQTDLVAGQEFDQVEVVALPVGKTASKARRVVIDISSDQRFFPAAQLGELPAMSSGDYWLEVELRRKQSGRLVTDRPVLASVRDNLALTVPITRSCLNVLCDEGEACFGGVCVDAGCTVETPERCRALTDASGGTVGADTVQCTQQADCALSVSCAQAQCDLGVCWASPLPEDDPNACDASSEWCHPDARGGGPECLPLGVVPATTSSCSDGILNGDETQIDCGGSCSSCPISTVVEEGCRDGVQNGSETAIDCGGSCTPCSDVFDCNTQGSIPAHECHALVAFYEATSGHRWGVGYVWLGSNNPCNWYGVSCRNGGVTRLEPEHARIDGTLPPEIGNLVNLEQLVLDRAELRGTVPRELGNLTKLTLLRIYASQLTGTLPSELGSLTELTSLDLSWNRIEGSIPPAVGNLGQLRELQLWENELTGTLPRELGNLSALETLRLDINNLSGALPDELEAMTNLQRVDLRSNRFRGAVPASLQAWTSLSSLDMELNDCLWAEQDCDNLLPWLDSQNPTWDDNRGADCTPPPNACR